MFKLESYIAPLLMSYINKYVKLQQEDFSLSLWGGDAVLNKLDLRLDAIESALSLPITFKSGHIYELRIHVPWTKLGSEPVVITINTIECILRLKDGASEDGGESSGGRSASSGGRAAPGAGRPRLKRQDTEDLPPGYLQSLVNRIVNNVNVVINNLILKFVEDDIVLSVNVKSAECYSVNQDWKRAFVELTMPELVLRRVFDFHDLTVCLDRRNASGKIDAYQDPLLYRCSLTCRIHMIHDSINAKLPSITRFNLLCEQLDLSLTDTQLPMFCRLVELIVALYYGTLHMSDTGTPSDDTSSFTTATQDTTPSGLPGMDMDPSDQQGWASWAWSYVPQILPSGEEFEEDGSGPRRKPQMAVLSLGFYIKKASVVFKLTETVVDGTTYSGSSRLNFVPCLVWEANGITLDVLMRGLVFFNVQFGVTGSQMTSQGDAICGVSDLTSRDPCFMKSGSCLEEKSHPLIGFMTGSLFDPGGAENQAERPAYIFEEDKHLQRFTETFALVKYGAFWMDYLYTMEEREDTGDAHSSNASQTQSEVSVKENSQLRFLFGPSHVTVSSSMVQRLHKFVYCMGCHEYEPYSKPQKEIVDESRAPPTDVQARHLEEYTPTRTYHVTMTKPVMWILANDLPGYDVRKRKVVSQRKAKKTKLKSGASTSTLSTTLPAGVLQAERIDLQLTAAMYPRRLVQLVSKMATPSSNLLHHCHSHMYLKLFSVQAGLSRREASGKLSPIQNIVQPWSGAYYRRSLLFPMYWKNSLQAHRECMYELPHLTVNLTKPQLLLILHTVLTWAEAEPGAGAAAPGVPPGPAPGTAPSHAPRAARTTETSLMDDVFKNVELRTSRKRPVLEASVSGVEIRDCVTPAVRAVTATLTATQAMVIHVDAGHDTITPLMYGPLDTSGVVTRDYVTTVMPASDTTSEDFFTFTLQLPATPDMPAAPAVLRLDVRGMALTSDPILFEWMRYSPTPLKTRSVQKAGSTLDAPLLNIDASLAESSSPLKSQGSESESGRTVPTDTPTASHTAPLSATKPGTDLNADPPLADQDEEDKDGLDKDGWPQLLARHFPLFKIMEVQVDVRTFCLFLPSAHVRLTEVTMDIPRNMAAAFRAGSLPETLVVSFPALHLHSAGHKGAPPAVVDLPIRTVDQSVSGEKLPWSVDLNDFSVYSLHPPAQSHYMVDPASMSATVAVTTKYHPPTSDTITALGLCVHADMNTVTVSCSQGQVVQVARLVRQMSAQIQQLCDLGVSMVSATSRLVTSVTAQLGSVKRPVPTPLVTEPVRPPLASSPLKAVANIPTMSTSSQLDPPVTITETSDTLSRETTPVRDLEDSTTVKLSLWIQWTLPKFDFVIFSMDERGNDIRVVTEIEDVATSIDVQDVYSKVKVKVGMLNVSHGFKETETSKWQPGDHEGLLLTSFDKLNQNVVVVSNKTWSAHSTQAVPNLFTDSHSDTKPRDKSHGFLTVTFTRALCKNIKKRMKKMALEGFPVPGDDGAASSAATGAGPGKGLVYLNELCVNLQPCDLVLNCPVLAAVVKVFTWRCHVMSDVIERPVTQPVRDAERSTEAGSPAAAGAMPLLTPATLPLIYVNTSNFRLLVPRCDVLHHNEADTGPGAGDALGADVTTTSHDVWVAHLRALTLTPIADNPLPRIVLEKEVYRRAMHAGMTQQPGSEVEDRQYQLDMAGLSLSTGRWRDLVVDEKTKEEDSLAVQHPALEWNNLMRQRMEKEEVRLTPVATTFDLRVVAAPAVVYRHVGAHGESQPLLVCGHSLEINATSDMDFYLSNLQIKLALEVFSTNVAALLGAGPAAGAGAAGRAGGARGRREKFPEDRREDGALIDSGVDSETSTCVTGFQRVPAVVMTAPEPEVTLEEAGSAGVAGVVPFDVLLTAGKLTFMTYMHQQKPVPPQPEKPQSRPGTNVLLENVPVLPRTKANLEFTLPPIPGFEPPLFIPASLDPTLHPDPTRDLELESTLTTTDSGIDLEGQTKSSEGQAGSVEGRGKEGEVMHIVPFLYATFSQPHSMLKVERTKQKLELSCYDVIVKGAKPGHSFHEEQRLIPDSLDYGVHWLETKAGEANPKTGIPPSLYTVRMTDFLLGPADVLLRIERPLKVNVSITRAEQVMTYIRDLLPYFSDLLTTDSDSPVQGPERDDVTQTSEQTTFVQTQVARAVKSIQVDTVQAVLYMETRPDPQSPSFQLSVSDIDTNLSITTRNSGGLQAVGFNFNVAGFQVKTGYSGTLRPLIGPLSLILSTDANWTTHSGPAHLPSVLCSLEMGLVPVTFGQEHVLCLQLVSEHIAQFLQTLHSPASTKHEPIKVKHSKDNQRSQRSGDDLDLQASVDDLRAGDFEYNTEDSSPDLLPRPNEIVFSEDREEGQATMTWCYPEPRVVTFLHVTPVPFTLPHQPLATRFINEDLKVPCILQYWNALCRDFEDYATFNVSQSEAVSVPLREVTSDTDPEVVAAQVWRTLILHPQDRESEDAEVEEGVEPIVSPMTLAASLRVDSCFSASLIPILQLAASATSIQLRAANHYKHLSKDVPDKLRPYTLDAGFFNHDHELAVITLENPTLTLSHVTGKSRRVTMDANASVQCDVIEYRNLTMRPLLENVDIICGATWRLHSEHTLLRMRGEVGPLYVRVGEGAVHTLSAASHAYSQLLSPSACCVLPHYYLVCNNTRQVIRVGQVGTDEEVTIGSHQILPYGWRSHKIQQLLQLTVEGLGGQWSDPINIDKLGTSVVELEHKGQKVIIIIKVKSLTGIQRQVEVSGTLLVGSRLSQHLEVKVSSNKNDKLTEGAAVLGSGSSLPSYVMDPSRLCAVRVKLFGLKTAWSQEVAVTGEKAKDSRLVKVPLADKGSFIHVWCHIFTEHHQGAAQYIVLFVPLFTVRTHFPAPLLMNVETPRLKSSRREELKGQGHEEHMLMVGGDMTHNITFQLSAGEKPSSPPITLSSGMYEQVPRTALERVSAELLLTGWTEDLSETWPYNDIENISSTEPMKSPLVSQTGSRTSAPQEVAMAVTPGENAGNQPNIDLQISLRQRWAGCNTLLIDIAPCWMMVNATDLDLVVVENNEQQWRLLAKQTFAPPLFDGPFRVGVVCENRLHMSDPLTLSEQEMTFRYLEGEEDTLYSQGHLKVTIPVVINQKATQLCYLTLHSVTSHTMRVVTVRETYVFSNDVSHDINIQAFCLPLSQHKVALNHDSVEALRCPHRASSPHSTSVIPMPLWQRPAPSPDDTSHDASRDVPHVQYVSLQRRADEADDNATPSWAFPCRIRVADQGTRLSLALPLGGSPLVTSACVLTAHQRAGMVYLTLAEDGDPGMEIHNNCGFSVAYGQALMGVSAEDKTVQEEAELTSEFLSVPPGGSVFYTFPASNVHYPQVSALPETPKLHLAGFGEQSEGGERLVWSSGLDLETEHDVFVNIPDVSDVKVHTEKVGHTHHIFIDPVSRAEVSAKEIRSRIKGKEKMVVVEAKRPKTPEAEILAKEQEMVAELKKRAKRKALHPLLTEAVVVCTYASFILLDEGSNPKVVTELLRVTADKVAALYFPIDLYDPFQQMRPHLTYTVTLTCGDLQVDNQMFAGQTYDFPVVFKRQTENSGSEFDEAFFHLSPKDQFEKVKKSSLMTLEMSLCTDLTVKVSTLIGVSLSLQPVTVFIEDTFVYDLLRRLDRFRNVTLSKSSTKREQGIVIPHEVRFITGSLVCPVRLARMEIEPLSILLSVHASLKLFIASDNTPLSFGKFARHDVFTNAPQLMRAVAVHYASGTLYRAGWVVGSLEILGNPTGLVRNVGIGISDMFKMPYQGLTQGPGAFVGGVTRGMGSLVRHISTGALTSVTNFASSVSRNMDRLSLDSVHRARQEEGRRHKPRGVSDGLINGLSGFGISLLGAVAGIADQPLQTLTAGGDRSAPTSPTRQATGLVSGVGKGIVGAITKPIGGAAELVSQTGLGLLQGTGLTAFPTPRHAPVNDPAAAAPSSTLKVVEKLLATVPNAEVLAVVDALSVDSRSTLLHQQQVSLLLTQEILFIVNTADDTPLQAYAVSEITCHGSHDDPSLLAIMLGANTTTLSVGDAWTNQLHEGALPEGQMNNKDRVAAFLGGATGLGHMTCEDQSARRSPRVHSGSPTVSAQHEFHVDTQTRQLFLAHFTAAKRKLTGVGFPV